MVTVVAQIPASGVKVYVCDALLSMTAGDHVPVMPLSEIVGNVGIGVVPAQNGAICWSAKDVGVRGVMLMLSWVTSAHWLAAGVNI